MKTQPELERIDDQISLIMLHVKSGMNPDQALAFQDATNDIKKRYDAAVRTLADANASAADKKWAKDVTDSINKNLPHLTKGVLSAVSSFKSGDYLSGSAAIMDICASAAQMIGGLSSAAGPYGAAFGAVFTLVGQLLTYFGPKQPSLIKQIEDLIKAQDADTRLREIRSYGYVVDEYATTIDRISLVLPGDLKKPLVTIEDVRDFRTHLGKDLKQIKTAYDKLSALYKKWDVAAWLEDEKCQELEKWPEILGLFCRVYSDSLLANMTLASMYDKQLVDQRLDDASGKNPLYKENSHELNEVNNLLIKLRTLVAALPELWDDGNKLVLQFLERVRPVAQDRGLFVHIGTSRYLYAATGRKQIKSDSYSWKDMPIGYGGRGHRFSITVPREERGSLKPQYHVFFCEHWVDSGGGMEHGRVKPSSVEIFGQGAISPDKFSDVWALPAPPDEKRDKRATFVYAAHDGDTSGYVKLFELNEKNQLTEGGWCPATKSGVVNVRAITHPPTTLPDDPDKDGMPPGSLLLRGTDHYNSIIYGALRASSEIYVDQSNTRCYVPSPWGTYSGVEVDPYYVWVFRPEGFACATHASVISCIAGKRKAPRWMEHTPADILGDMSDAGVNHAWWVNGQETRPKPALKGLVSFSPCKDGTIFASAYHRTVSKWDRGDHRVFEAKDIPAMHTTTYSIDLKAGQIHVAGWTKCGGVGLQVQKMAIPCWAQFESLNAVLRAKLKTQ
jgi:hypothetical protein